MTPHRPPAREARPDRLHALACATGRLAEALRALEHARDAAPSGAAGCEALLEEVRERLWAVIVQREALGIWSHARLLEVLRVPPEVHAAARWTAEPMPA